VPSTSLAYRTVVRLGVALAPLIAKRGSKLHGGIAARIGATQRLAGWAQRHRDTTRPLLWIHAPSVGEGLQAEAVLLRLRRDHPGWQVAYTYFSPSAEGLASRQPCDVAEALPWDIPGDVDAALDALRPNALVFSKLDLWPELATRAAARGTRVGMIAATVSPNSGRLRWPALPMSRPGYAVVSGAGAVSEEDAARLSRLGVPAHRIEVTGDPRFDSVHHKVRAVPKDHPLLRCTGGAETLVAGSTWPEDELRLLTGWSLVRAEHPGARLILVPHEPTPAHLARLDSDAQRLGLGAPVRVHESAEPSGLMVVDRVGVLAALYTGASIAYVGGGFGHAGLHSVLEPAACGIPVLFGPEWKESRDAGSLVSANAAWEVNTDLDRRWCGLLADPAARRGAGKAALDMVEAGLGAAARSAGLIERLVLQNPATSR